ncbi:hypothetical protein NUU61_007072 [Penicillium alfredii]|uniref:Uncharacterized protein n=1 Tax=Penicillium alfredii TaxID=1506179 RepID=A0A9W9F246_9EURO|nr:uncharacterized protein NUU61_007072 [Penicillium alfredii]KAJ5092202.1 hypothetical protein NUU61_007072 [Penicillium alfredii]
MTDTNASTRLHISPFTPDILPSVLPPSLRSSASDISFHTIPTFPENNYGYVTLPAMEAEKIKKKLNGSILKGKKFKVETARPQKRQPKEEDVPETTRDTHKPSKKRKAQDEVLDGYEMPSDRKVKRGWTESTTAKKDRRKSEKKTEQDKKAKAPPKSKYTEKAECLFRTTVPPNRSSEGVADEKKAKKKKSAQESVVHEFSKTVTHPSFLRSAEESAPPTATFEDGKGWVDVEGQMKEASSEKARKDDFRPGKVAGAKEKRQVRKESALKESSGAKGTKKSSSKRETPEESSAESEDWTSSSGSSSESSDSDSDSGGESEGISSSSDDSSASSAKELNPQAPFKETKPEDAVPESASRQAQVIDSEPVQDAKDSSAQEVHPLEALFKRSAPAESKSHSASENAGFSFFGNEDLESEDEPQTPFTTKDLQNRGLRSAAPTPDTAMVNRRMKWTEEEEEYDDDEESSIDTPVSKRREPDNAPEETEFAKWFWEHRGENNRAWKKRRRDAAKEQRQRENRKKGLKGNTIIPLEPADPEASSPPFDDVLQRAERGFGSSEGEETYNLHRRGSQYQARSCNDCTRKFCLNYDLPMCKRAKEDDVFTSCFQRDSRKDEVVVFLFIFATGGLLGWAVFKPWVERYMEAARERRSYMPVAETG